MSYQEKNAWWYGCVAVLAYAVYVTTVLVLASNMSLEQTAYQLPMLISIGVAIVLGILGGIVIGTFSPKRLPRSDQRDREISRFGDFFGQAVVIAGAIVALIFAMVEFHHFWIANVLYLAFVLYAVVSSAARVITYRREART